RRKPSFPLRRPQEGSTLEDLPILRDRPAYRGGTTHLGDFAPHHSPQEVTQADFVPVLKDLQLSRLPHPDEFGSLRVLRQELTRLTVSEGYADDVRLKVGALLVALAEKELEGRTLEVRTCGEDKARDDLVGDCFR